VSLTVQVRAYYQWARTDHFLFLLRGLSVIRKGGKIVTCRWYVRSQVVWSDLQIGSVEPMQVDKVSNYGVVGVGGHDMLGRPTEYSAHAWCDRCIVGIGW